LLSLCFFLALLCLLACLLADVAEHTLDIHTIDFLPCECVCVYVCAGKWKTQAEFVVVVVVGEENLFLCKSSALSFFSLSILLELSKGWQMETHTHTYTHESKRIFVGFILCPSTSTPKRDEVSYQECQDSASNFVYSSAMTFSQ